MPSLVWINTPIQVAFKWKAAFENDYDKNNFAQIAQKIMPVIKGRLSLAQWVLVTEPVAWDRLSHWATGGPSGQLLVQVGPWTLALHSWTGLSQELLHLQKYLVLMRGLCFMSRSIAQSFSPSDAAEMG